MMQCKKKYTLVLAITLFGIPLLVSAQWLETTIAVGSQPYAFAYNPPPYNKIYCANRDSDNVTLIDGATNSVITTLPVGGQPWALVYNSTNNKVYCANYESDDVTVIDGATNGVITTITVGYNPCALAWNPVQNRTYVASFWDYSVSVIRDSLTGIEEIKQNASPFTLDIYPNPITTSFIINSTAPITSIMIYEILGRLVKTVNLAKAENTTTISARNLSVGVYFMKVTINDTEFIRKVIITK